MDSGSGATRRSGMTAAQRNEDLPMFEKGLLAGKRILVTGGGSGLGAAMGRRFIGLGAELIICGRRLELLEATAGRSAAILAARSARSNAIYATARQSMP